VKAGERTVVQAKRYTQPVGNKAVQEVVGSLAMYDATKAMVVTTNKFTPAAIKLADANLVELVNRDALEELMERYL
jgi:restriction system protein